MTDPQANDFITMAGQVNDSIGRFVSPTSPYGRIEMALCLLAVELEAIRQELASDEGEVTPKM